MKKITSLLQINLLFVVFLITQLSLAQSIATYDISLTTIWNTTDHTSVPGTAHWSDLIGAAHNTTNEFMEIGQNASSGIKNVAESGSNGAITTIINNAITAGNADQLLQDGFPDGAISTAGFSGILISEDFPLITLVSMVAPSPDWFIAINSLTLRSGNNAINNGWKDTFVLDVFAYDAGTDSGSNYTSSNSPNSPVGIFMITGAPINGNRMGTITFTYDSSTLGIEEINAVTNIKIYPNPTKDVINISNIQNIDLKTIEVYNILGSLVLQVNIKDLSFNDNLQLDLSDFKKGVYFTKIIADNYQSITHKLIIE